MTKLYFATTNINKFNEVKSILSTYNIKVDIAKLELLEIQSDDLIKIASEKTKSAIKSLNSRVIVEDDGLFIEVLKGFPGAYSSSVHETIGNNGILKLMLGHNNRNALFKSVIAYCEPKGIPFTFVGEVRGSISLTERGNGWGYDPIFQPDGENGLTYGELVNKKNEISHRRLALESFARWYTKR